MPVQVGGADGAAGDLAKAGTLGRSVVRAADLTVRVDDVAAAARSATRTAEANGGYLEGEDSTTERTSVTVRVPPEDFTATLDAIAKLGTVVTRTANTKDVTNDVADVDGRLKAARASVARVRDLMDRADTITEVTSLEAELNKREADLESLETRQRTLAGQATYATVTATFVTKPPPPAKKKVEATGFASGLRAGWDAFVGSIRVVLTIVGVLLPFAASAALVTAVVLAIRRKVSARAAHQQ